MAYTNPGLAIANNANAVAVMTPVNTQVNPVTQASNGRRLLGVVKGVSLITTGDVVQMPIINSTAWVPELIVTANGTLAGAQGSVATAALGVFTAAAAGGTAIKANATLANNSAVGSAISLATTVANLAFTNQTLFINVGTALATAAVDIYLYGTDLSA